jgi:DNA-binding MarR family transcriptional regulator
MTDDPECQFTVETAIPLGTIGRTAFTFVKVGHVIEDMADEVLADASLDSRGYCILAILSVDGPDSQHELSSLLGVAPGVMVAAIDQLEGHGFVQRNRDPSDRRRSRVTLTPGGEAALAHADRIADAAVAQLLSGLGPDEISQLSGLLARGLATNAAQPAGSE